MISNPHIGQAVQIWYGQRTRAMMPLHGRLGVVMVAGRGRPRNHVVLVQGMRFVVPAGNLRSVGNNAVAWVE